MGEVSIERVSLSFKSRKGDDVVALNNLSLQIPDKQFAVIVGPSEHRVRNSRDHDLCFVHLGVLQRVEVAHVAIDRLHTQRLESLARLGVQVDHRDA